MAAKKRDRGDYWKKHRLTQKEKVKNLELQLQTPIFVFFQTQSVPEDGNCLFASIGFLISKSHRAVRTDIHRYLSRNKNILAQVLPEERGPYLAELKKLGTHGGENELIAASQLYKRNYRVFVQTEAGSFFLLASFPPLFAHDETLNLLLRQAEDDEANHYSPLLIVGTTQ